MMVMVPRFSGLLWEETTMSRRHAHLILLAGLLVVPALSAGGRPGGKAQAAERQPTTDRYGDPLPEGAIARLGTMRFRHPGWLRTVAYAPDGKTLVSTAENDSLCLWNADDGRLLRRFDKSPSQAAAYSPDGKVLAAVGRLGQKDGRVGAIRLWDALTGKELRTIQYTPAGAIRRVPTALVFTPDSKTLLTADDTGMVHGWDLANGKQLRQEPFAVGARRAIALSPDGTFLAFSDERARRVTLTQWRADKLRWSILVDRPVLSMAFSPDGKLLATSSDEPGVRIWEVEGGRFLRQLPSRDGSHYVRSVAFSPDGKSPRTLGGWLWHRRAGCASGTQPLASRSPNPPRRIAGR